MFVEEDENKMAIILLCAPLSEGTDFGIIFFWLRRFAGCGLPCFIFAFFQFFIQSFYLLLINYLSKSNKIILTFKKLYHYHGFIKTYSQGDSTGKRGTSFFEISLFISFSS
jgi:hypothetical protein